MWKGIVLGMGSGGGMNANVEFGRA